MNQNEQLNRGQMDAVMHADGPCVVIAPPGSGKTKVLTLHISILIDCYGVLPEHILVMTFTRAAAGQMRERYLLCRDEVRTGVTFGTFHAVFYQIVRESLQMGAVLNGYQTSQPLQILSEKEKKQILTSIVNQSEERRGRFGDIDQLCAAVSRRKNRMEAEEMQTENTGEASHLETADEEKRYAAGKDTALEGKRYAAGKDTAPEGKRYIGGKDDASGEKRGEDETELEESIYREYCRACRELGRLDFEDITDCCKRILQDGRNARILAYWRDKYRYLLVDEFQDISPVQFAILRMIAAPNDRLFVVGDDDQSIYGFRGADTKLMLTLPEYYHGMNICRLTVNYRSGKKIVAAARRLIEHNCLRYDKEIAAGKTEEGNVRVVVCPEKKTQMRIIGETLLQIPADETAAVILRTHAQAEEIKRAAAQFGVHAAVKQEKQGAGLYEHPVAKDVLAYLKLAVVSASGKTDMESLLRIVNKPYRGVSRHEVIRSGGSVGELCRFYEESAPLMGTIRLFQKQLSTLAGLPPSAAFSYVCRIIGYEWKMPNKPVKATERETETQSVLALLLQEAGRMRSLDEWLAAVEGGIFLSETPEEKQGHILVLTMHACKGLEFDHVVLPYLNEGVIPHKKAFLPEELEEERRLLYVAMTRAKKNLLMTCIHKQGDQKYQMSRFLRELIE